MVSESESTTRGEARTRAEETKTRRGERVVRSKRRWYWERETVGRGWWTKEGKGAVDGRMCVSIPGMEGKRV